MRLARVSKSSERGFTLVELLVVIGIIALLISILLPSLSRARESANRIKCGSNLRQIALSVVTYATEHRGKFPRTYYQPNQGLENKTIGGKGQSPTANPFSATNPAGPVGVDNVGASLYLLLKYKYVGGSGFMCPSLPRALPIDEGTADDYSNFPSPKADYLSYSYAAPFPNSKAVSEGWKLDLTSSPDWPIASDINPGTGTTYSDTTGGTNLVAYNDPMHVMARGNSNNHKNVGQQIAYVDGHVEWHTSPFAGAQKPGRAWRDNIFASSHNVNESTGVGGGPHKQPNDRYDVVMHPGDGQ